MGIGLILSCAALTLRPTYTLAQSIPVPVQQHGASPVPLDPAAQLRVDLFMYAERRWNDVLPQAEVYPNDSLVALRTARASRWVDSLQAHGVHGFQLDVAGRIAVVAGRDSIARRLIDTRLATPGLSIQERARTYWIAVDAFADREYPDRLPIAEAYLDKLDALGAEAVPWQSLGHLTVYQVHAVLGHRDRALTHLTHAITLEEQQPFEFRGGVCNILPLAESLAETSTGHATLRTLYTRALATTEPTPDRVALDSADIMNAANRRKRFCQGMMMASELFWTPAPPLRANLWLNAQGRSLTPTPPSASPSPMGGAGLDDRLLAVNDGTIRVVAMLAAADIEGFLGLQRLQQRLGSSAQVIAIAGLSGSWGTVLVPGDDEVKHLQEVYAKTVKPTFPIGFWIAPKQQENRWTGTLPPDPPAYAVYHPSFATIAIYVIDGTGRFRRIERWRGRDSERDLATFVQTLAHQPAR